MTQDEADKAQQWAGMDGATAWHLIERHADNWNEVGEMMNAWLRANVAIEREACAKACEDRIGTDCCNDDWSDRYDQEAKDCAAAIRARGSCAPSEGAKE